MRKIFCIGFQKTGTTSLGRAFEKLGYKVCGVTHEIIPDLEKGNVEKIREYVDGADLCKDNPWPVLYAELDQMYPGSKFILTIREPNSWIQSVVNHFGATPSALIQFIYGKSYPKGNESIFLKKYNQHNQDVKEYFKSRPDDLLVLDLDTDLAWEKICPFLSIEKPDFAFPHSNKGAYTRFGKARKFIVKRLRARWRDAMR